MKSLLPMAIALLTIAATASAQAEEFAKFYSQQAPVVAQFERQAVIFSLHSDGMASAVYWNGATLEVSIGEAGPDAHLRLPPQDPAPATTVTTTWTDANGVTWSVATPFAGTTPAATRRALDQHNALVTAMQSLHPPAPPKPAPAPAAGSGGGP